MSLPKFVEVNGQRVAWKELLRLRREQAKASRQPQPTLFPLQQDARPQSQRSASGRYEEPTLFKD